MLQRERLEEIRQTVKREKQVSVSVLSKQYNVTEETIRRDLEKLKEEGLVSRTYGGAVLIQESIPDNIEYTRRALMNVEAKSVIGSLAASIIPQKATIGADASSTVMETIIALGDRSETTILTNSVRVLISAEQFDFRIMSTGGLVNKNTLSMQGLRSRRVLEEYNVEIVLLGCKALDLSGGVYDSNEEEAQWKKVMISRGQKVILLADHTKFNKVAFVEVIGLDGVDTVVTDMEPSEEWKELFRRKNVKVVYPQ